jgi:P-type Cu+ transporter
MNKLVEEVATTSAAAEAPICYHCGHPCTEAQHVKNGNTFCCFGCQTVYDILAENNLCEYYTYEATPGIKQEHVDASAFAYLDEPTILQQVVIFQSADFCKLEFYVPAIHCISCVWLLENLNKLNAGVLRVRVDFPRKRVAIEYNPQQLKASKIASLMASIGYAPHVQMREAGLKTTNTLLAKVGVAGFAFGNIMLLSFPEYLGLPAAEGQLHRLFSFVILALAVPVLLFSANDYFRNALTSLRQRQLNIDVPIALGLAALFFRSTIDILWHVGPGYLDSFSGLVFFLLIGRWFQDKTYSSLSFDRDFKSYFPLAVNKLVSPAWKPTLIYDLKQGDIIKVRNLEVVPADSQLHSPHAFVDYSFVTGESKPVACTAGTTIFAGGRLLGQPVVLEVIKPTSQSYLTSLWNHTVFKKSKESQYTKIIDRAAKGFTWFVLFFSMVAAWYWYQHDASRMWLIITSILVVACPCALALAAPFTYGSMLRVFGRKGFYLKNADVIERMAAINALVFDKTGTLTHGTASVLQTGDLTEKEVAYVKSLAVTSTHPLSELLAKHLKGNPQPVTQLIERAGKGIEGMIEGNLVRLGSAAFVGATPTKEQVDSTVFISINNTTRGYFSIRTETRSGVGSMLKTAHNMDIALLSGDNESDALRMKEIFPTQTLLKFNQAPSDKMQFIREWRADGKQVMMVGDGLNDAGALQQSDVGIAVSDSNGLFTPACDGIIKGDRLAQLNVFRKLARQSTTILKIAFGISFLYNAISLAFAATGHLTPLVAAILMPISSISVVGFCTVAVRWVSLSAFSTSYRS